jgi:CBS domain-containing protein
MMYFSQLLRLKVRDSADTVVGRLKDILIDPKPGRYAPLLFLVVATRRGDSYIPFSFVANLGNTEITLKNPEHAIPKTAPSEDCVFLDRDIIDEQIVDIDGARVVRVNDLKLGVFRDQMSVLGIDVSFKAILRRLGVDLLDVFDFFKVNLIDWRKAQRVKGALRVDSLSNDLIRLHPADLANIVEDLSAKHGARLVTSLDHDTAAQVLEELDPRRQKILVSRLGPEKSADILEKMPVDELTDLIQMLPEQEAKRVLAQLPDRKLGNVERLLVYKDDSAGGLMTTDMVQVQPDWTVAETLEEIKLRSKSMRSLLYVYVVDGNGTFRGAVSLRRLLISEPAQLLSDLIPKDHPISVLQVEDSIRDVVRTMTKYDLYTAAVVDAKHRLLGMVTIDDVMRFLYPEA